MKVLSALVVVVSVSVVTISGCHVTENKDGKKGDVAISTPFGSMNVKTDDNGNDAAMIGLSIYPGAVPSKGNHSDHDSADVNLSFGDFHLGVKAATYQTSDSSDKVLAFYRKDMAKYGDVIECRDNKPIGSVTKTSQGLTCSDQNKRNIHTDSDDHKHEIQLRTGSEHLQRIVGVQDKDGGTRIGLVYLNVPTHLGDDKDKTAE